MFINLKKALEGKNISMKSFAAIIGVSEKSAQNKIYGRTEFTLSEVETTLRLFPEFTLKFLFQKDEKEEVTINDKT